ncbi:MAG: YitT family protein [Lachnospiraceae bacterium]|nr:YitT family protein [Lachnospiraceae bacterium]
MSKDAVKTKKGPGARKTLLRILVITVASFLLALNVNTFVNTGGLYPGGVMGLTVLIQRAIKEFFGMDVPYTIINVILNFFPVYIGFRYIGKRFTAYSLYVIMLTNIFTDLLPKMAITNDPLLIAVFGGIMNGLVITMCLLSNATTGGTDFISIFLSERKGVDSWNVILCINIVILAIAGIIFGWEKALYSIIFQFVATQVLNTFYRRYQKETFFIVTNKPREICEEIYKLTGHGATILEGEGSYEHCTRNVVYSIVSADDKKKVNMAIRKIDPEAFVNTVHSQSVSGKFYLEPKD